MLGPFLVSHAASTLLGATEASPSTPSPQRTDTGTSMKLKELTEDIQRLRLLNQALWELLRERAGLTDEQFEAKIKEIDLRDGVEDGRMTDTAVQCPRCQRISNSKHRQCLYCGARFKMPVMR